MVLFCHRTVSFTAAVSQACRKFSKTVKKKKNGANGKAVSDEATVQSGSKYKLGLDDILFSQKQFNKYY